MRKLDDEKILAEERRSIHYWYGCYSEKIENMFYDKETGPSAWFRGFVQSGEFEKLTPAQKAEAFNYFDDLSYVLNKFVDIQIEQL